MRRAVALAGWLADSGPRLLTGREVLRKPDVPAAAAVIGVKAPQTLRSAADVPDLPARGSLPWPPGWWW